MDCHEAKALIEKLADEEANERESREARSHLSGCASCRADHELLLALSRASSRPLPEPPPGYFEALPERILARIDATAPSAPSPSRWARLLAPDALRWEALAAVLLAALSIGLVVEREGLLHDSRALAPEAASPSASAPPVKEAEVAEETEKAGAGSLQDEALPSATEKRPAPAPLQQPIPAEPPLARDRRQRAAPEQDAAAFAEAAGSVTSPGAPIEAEARKEEEPVARGELKLAGRSVDPERASVRADSPAPAAESLAQSVHGVGSDCERWRRYLEETVPEGDEAREARYRLARCSVDRFRGEEAESLRETAIADAEAFLEIESEGPRADEIREILESLR